MKRRFSHFLFFLFFMASTTSGICQISNTNDISRFFIVEPFALIHKHDYGFGIDISTARTNILNAGLAFAAINENKKWQFFSATLSLKAGKQFNIPRVNIPIYCFIENGANMNMNNLRVINSQQIVGFKTWNKIGKRDLLSYGLGVGRNSTWGNDVFYVGYFSLSF